jgi:hypothetical protein
MIILSTSSPDDLSQYNTHLLRFNKTLPSLKQKAALLYPYQWFVGSKDGCSCAFRHLSTESISLGFDQPVDWFEEELDDIEATQQFYAVIEKLTQNGYQVDCIDAWDNQDDQCALAGREIVNVSDLKPAEFRFFENYQFDFVREDRA